MPRRSRPSSLPPRQSSRAPRKTSTRSSFGCASHETRRPPGERHARHPEREAARREARHALLAQGSDALCERAALGVGKAAASGSASSAAPAAEDPTSPEVLARDLGKAEAQLTELEGALAKTDKPTPIDLASRSRAACLSVLSRARRASAPQGATGSADALLQELSGLAAATQKQGSLDPERDERGVVLTLRAAFDGDAPSAAARARLEELDRVANAHPSFPVAVIVHTDKPMKDADKTVWMSRGQALAALLKSVPSDKKVVVVAGDALPATAVASEKAKNARVEIVFIAPEAL
ncbi:MAG: hypothetical protein U0271_03950 [Polyangiaceae bacterium]